MALPAEDDRATGWFVGIIVALALLAIGYLVFAGGAKASDLNDIEAGTYGLYEGLERGCSSQAVRPAGGEILILTAAHCIGSADAEHSIHLTSFDEHDRKVEETIIYLDIVKVDKTTDFAILRPVDRGIKIAAVDLATVAESDEFVTKGATVLAAGFPGSNRAPPGELVFTQGLFTGLSDAFVDEITVKMFRTTVPVFYGSSGGGLYAKVDPEIDSEWRLVGITSQLDPDMPWMNTLFVSTATIHAALKAAGLVAPPTTDD